MNTKRLRAAGLAAVLLFGAAASRAEPAYPLTEATDVASFVDRALASGAETASPTAEGSLRDAMTLASSNEARLVRLSASHEDLSLFAYVTTLRALQRKQSFAVLQGNARLVELSAANVAPVPLPGAAWAMTMALAGLLGWRRLNRASARPGPQPALAAA